ncbi:ferrous iron transport protein A [Desulfovibrio sp. OttesenSCG-928-C14]|nr:ferrous iron transport protein A [Desulfovibrio sp. OttesenSCG-928-C14]
MFALFKKHLEQAGKRPGRETPPGALPGALPDDQPNDRLNGQPEGCARLHYPGPMEAERICPGHCGHGHQHAHHHGHGHGHHGHAPLPHANGPHANGPHTDGPHCNGPRGHCRPPFRCGRHCSLHELPPGHKARITGFTVDGALRARLCAMGITPGAEVQNMGGPFGTCKLQVRGGCLALDGKMAKNILCEYE